MKELEKIASLVRQAAKKYDMIAAGDRIAVGLSGGKDSAALLVALRYLEGFYPVPFGLVGIFVNPGFSSSGGENCAPKRLCASLGVEYREVQTDIAARAMDNKTGKIACSLCARMRRAALTDAATEAGANRLALGHHMDDAGATFLMSLTQGGRIGCFSPVTVYEDRALSVIRPLIYCREREIRALVRAGNYPTEKNPCPADGATGRAEAEALLREMDRSHRGLYRKIVGALERAGIDGWRTGD